MAQDLKDKTLGELENLVLEFGQKKYLAGYIFKFVHGRAITDISQISPLSKEFRRRLMEGDWYISGPANVGTIEDPDGTIKYLFELEDGTRVEAVLLSDDGRKTVCISTQAGCAMNCAFCATGRLGPGRNLSAAEIVDQVGSIRRDKHRISSVVYMGMGEPLSNYDAVIRSVRILNNAAGYNIGIRHITISTCGIPSAIERLADENIHPRLAISLNAAANSLRTKLMPINEKYPIESVLRVVKMYQSKTRRRVTFEYVLIKGINDTVTHALMFAKLVAGIRCNINLIEFNSHPGCQFVGSDRKAVERFAETLRAAGLETSVRYRKGRKIRAACGQLGADMPDK